MKKICFVMLCFIVTASIGACGKENNYDTIIGNSAANHANGGLFCMTDDAMIIYSQLNEHGKVYMAEPDGSGRKLLLEDGAYKLNCIGDEVYYQKMSDSTVWRYDVAKMQVECVIAEGVQDIVVTNQDLIYLTEDACWKNDKGETAKLFDVQHAQYLDYNNPVIYYTALNQAGLLNLYQWESAGQELLIMEDIRGSVVIGDILYYTGEENNLVNYNMDEKSEEGISDGYNVQRWNERLFYIDGEKIYTYVKKNEIQELGEVYDLQYQEYEFHSYYICGDYMYLIFHDETSEEYLYKGINLQNGDVFDL